MMFSRNRKGGQSQSLSPRRRPFLRTHRLATSTPLVVSPAAATTSKRDGTTTTTTVGVLTTAAQHNTLTAKNGTTQLVAGQRRSRLDTADTLRMSNLDLPDLMLDDDDNDNPFLECHPQYSAEAVARRAARRRVQPKAAADCASTVSSLGSGSFQMPAVVPPVQHQQQQQQQQQVPQAVAGRPPQHVLTPRTEQQQQQQQNVHRATVAPVPKVICFRVKTEVPDWLLEDDDDDDEKGDNDRESLQKQSHGGFLTNDDDDDDTAENHPLPLVVVRPTAQTTAVSPLPRFRPRHAFAAQQQQQQAPPLPFPPLPRLQQAVHRQTALQQQQQQSYMVLSPVRTELPSPANNNNNLRPTMGRYKSVSSSNLFPIRTPRHQAAAVAGGAFPYSPCTTAAATTTAIIPSSPIRLHQRRHVSPMTPRQVVVLPAPRLPMQAAVPVPPPPPPTLVGAATTPKTTPKLLPPSSSSPALSLRKAQHMRNASNDGSLLGHGSLWTAPTVASSSHNSSRDVVDGGAAHARRTSAVVQELRSLWSKVVGPPPSPGLAPPSVSTAVVNEWEWQQQQHHGAHGCWT